MNKNIIIILTLFIICISIVSAETLYYNFGNYADDNNHYHVTIPLNAVAQKFTTTNGAYITNISIKQWVNDYGCDPYNFHVAFFSDNPTLNQPNTSLHISGLRQGSACSNANRNVETSYYVSPNTTYWMVLYADNVTGTKPLGNYLTGTTNTSLPSYNNTKQCGTFNLTTGNCTSGWTYFNDFYARRTIAFDMQLYNNTDISCHPNWIAQYNESCNGIISQNFKTYYDSNTCNSTQNLPIDNGTIQSCCVENWITNDTLCNGWNYTINYYDNSSCGTNFTLPIDNGTMVDCHCYPNWIATPTSCVNNLQLLIYADSNICNSNESLPLNNGTYQSCSLSSVNTFAFSDDQLTLMILAFLIIIALACAILVHEGFFGMVALLFALMFVTFQYYHYPDIIKYATVFMILLFVVMWIVIARNKR